VTGHGGRRGRPQGPCCGTAQGARRWPCGQAIYCQPSRARLRLCSTGDARERAVDDRAADRSGRGRQFAGAGHAVVGRDGVISRLAQQLSRHRFVTICGSGRDRQDHGSCRRRRQPARFIQRWRLVCRAGFPVGAASFCHDHPPFWSHPDYRDERWSLYWRLKRYLPQDFRRGQPAGVQVLPGWSSHRVGWAAPDRLARSGQSERRPVQTALRVQVGRGLPVV
jgi:hypothetical protein